MPQGDQRVDRLVLRQPRLLALERREVALEQPPVGGDLGADRVGRGDEAEEDLQQEDGRAALRVVLDGLDPRAQGPAAGGRQLVDGLVRASLL